MLVRNDFNLSLNNLGTDTKSLEETGLARVHTGWASRDDDINGGDRAGLCVGADLYAFNDVGNLGHISVAEAHSDIEFALIVEDLEMIGLGPCVFSVLIVKIVGSWLSHAMLETGSD